MIRPVLLSMTLTVSMLSLQACERVPPASAVVVAPAASAETRRAAILRQLRAICPTPLTPARLTRAADYLEAHPDAFAIVSDLATMDKQTRICRGEPS